MFVLFLSSFDNDETNYSNNLDEHASNNRDDGSFFLVLQKNDVCIIIDIIDITLVQANTNIIKF